VVYFLSRLLGIKETERNIDGTSPMHQSVWFFLMPFQTLDEVVKWHEGKDGASGLRDVKAEYFNKPGFALFEIPFCLSELSPKTMNGVQN
jgi:hypothetical protein